MHTLLPLLNIFGAGALSTFFVQELILKEYKNAVGTLFMVAINLIAAYGILLK
jgi:hypothetical protein